MRGSGPPVVKDLVLLGGGHSHLAVLRRFGMKPVPGVRITLVCRDGHAPYSGMLPGHVAGHYGFDEAHVDLGALARFAGARFYRAAAVALDLGRKRVVCDGRPPVAFDLLSINTGSTPAAAGVPGAADHAVPVKPVSGFLDRWTALLDRAGRDPRPVRVAVVGAGAGGVELLLAIRHRLARARREAGLGDPECRLFGDSGELLPALNRRTRRLVRRILEERGVALHLGRPVAEVASGRLRAGDSWFEADEIFWATAAAAPAWPAEAGLAVDGGGFVLVDDRLRSVSRPDVFAAGDVAAMADHPRPKSGVIAVRQGDLLAGNLRRALLGRPLRRFRPQPRMLVLISTGERRAVASRGPWTAAGAWVWSWKDRIDRRFMDKHRDLPAMSVGGPPPLPAGLADAAGEAAAAAADERCGGCGAKVGAATLGRVLAALGPRTRDDVVIGLGAPDDAAVVAPPEGMLAVHTVDWFRALVDDPYLFGKIAANHCLGDVYAMGGAPRTALAIATVPFGTEAKTEDLLVQMMSGAVEVLDQAGCALVGGHTGEGAELGLGFAVNGLVEAGRLVRKGALRPGDALVLTKPLGTGVLFAADMKGKARRRWIDAALAHMTRSSREAADCLIAHGAAAATDVTGFGLLGHLVEMAEASGVEAALDLGAVPLMEGAADAARRGLLSSLHPENLRFESAVADPGAAARAPAWPLLFDPQTAGGLLAGVPGGRADDCVAALRAAGYAQARVVGAVAGRSGRERRIAVAAPGLA